MYKRQGTQNIGGPSRAVAIPQVGDNFVMAVLRQTGVVQFWNILFPGAQAGPIPALGFTLDEDGVTASQWQSLTYDSLDGKIYAGAANAAGAFLFAFTPHGVRDVDEAIQLNSSNTDPKGAGYVNDTMYVAQGDSGASTGNVYVYNSIARVLPVPPQEGFDGEDWTLDLAPYLANSITVTFKSGVARLPWLNLTHNVLTGTLPAVARSRQDDVYNIQLTATHVDRVQDFSVQLTVKYVENATWGGLPTVTLDQHVTPNIDNVHPPLVLSNSLHLSDYISNLSRAGTLTFAAQDDEGAGVQPVISSRTEGGVTITDVLTLTSPATLPNQPGAVASFNLVLRATNQIGTATATLPIDVNYLDLPVLQRLPAQSVNRDEIDTFDLSQFATGRPTVYFALGTIQPTLQESVATIISNANGHWSIHPNSALETTNTYNVNVIASNRVGTATRSFQLTVHGVPHVDRRWHQSGEPTGCLLI